MRRIAGAATAVVLVVAVALVASGAGGATGGGTYRVDAIFDNAGFLVAGQDVKIAGARVGKVEDVALTPDRHARVEMRVDQGFAPFRADADCTVQPQSLIGERFVQCYPGSTDGAPLKETDGVPTVPITNTHSPVDLDLVLSAFKAPEPQRLGLLLSSLGAGLAGRADDLNTIVRRANPALQQTTKVLSVLDANRAELRGLIADTEHVVHRLDANREDIARFVHSAGDLTATTAERKAALRRAVADLPGLLAQVDPYLDTVTNVVTTTPPTLSALDRAATPADQLVHRVGTLAATTRPAIRQLRATVGQARELIPPATPVLTRLNRLTRSAQPASGLVSDLFSSVRASGSVEGLQRFVYYGTAATARYDATSHLLGAYPIASICSIYATKPVAGCNAHFSSFRGQPAAKTHTTKTKHRGSGGDARAPAAPPAPAQTAPEPASTPAPAPKPTGVVSTVIDSVKHLFDPSAPAPKAATPPTAGGLKSLLDYLLK